MRKTKRGMFFLNEAGQAKALKTQGKAKWGSLLSRQKQDG